MTDPQNTPLQKQVAIVTGAGRGIGAAIGKRLAALGATVLLAARDQQHLAAVRQEIANAGGQAEAAPLDLRDPSSIDSLAQSVKQGFGRCDILVNNDGIGAIGSPLHEEAP